jgi:class 3 adenylate cyclase
MESGGGKEPVQVRLLGPLEVDGDDGRPLALGGRQAQTLFALLAVEANRVVAVSRLIDELWGDDPPVSARKTVQTYVSRLRKMLGSERLQSSANGYRLVAADEEIDALEFARLLAAGSFDPALGLWRGPALTGLDSVPALACEADRLEQARTDAIEQSVDVALAAGEHARLVPQLEALVREQPLREALHARLMLALYRAGRQADALALYRETRKLLVDKLGLEPQEELQRLQRQILAHDPELDLPRPQASVEPRAPTPAPAPAADAPERVRRPVTVVFADLVGSTTLAERLDPESLHGVLARYSEACADVLERHGGTVEKFVGDAVVAVFGLPRLHEDDALRAARAAVELRQVAADLSGDLEAEWGVGIDVRVAVNSGEVFVAAGGRRDAFASGDALNVAARLEQSAQVGEILLGEQTQRLVEHLVRAEPLEPLEVKGRAAKVQAWRLLDLLAEEPPRPATPFVGRERELAELEQALAHATTEHACRLCTVLGPPGIGKSRLTRELIEAVGDRATVLVGRCPSYGAGITYLPLAEIVRQLGRDPVLRLAELLEADDRAELIASLVLGTAGLAEGQSQTEDTAWAFRRLFEALARERPLVAVFEDLHWAEPALLDLLDSLAGFSKGAPILVLCLARPELLEQRASWATPQPTRTLLTLEPLPETHARALVDHLGPQDIDPGGRARIVETAEGNPLFLEQLTAVHAEGAEPSLPPTVQAVLAARIDRLDAGERTVLQRASVEGRGFHRGALIGLLPETERAALESRLIALVNKQLLRPDPPQLAGEDAFRFAHVLIREAAYTGLSKRLRAELHERIARWLEGKPDAQEEIVGYHLEQAARYKAELGQPDAALAERAGDHLAAAGRRALWRVDEPAAASLLERALKLTRPLRLDVQLELDLARVFFMADPQRAAALAEAALEHAQAAGDEGGAALARVVAAERRLFFAADADVDELEALAGAALPLLEQAGDHAGLAHVWNALALGVANSRGRFEDMAHASEQAIRHARLAGHPHSVLFALPLALILGPRPADEALRALDAALPENPSPPDMLLRAVLVAMLGRFDEAWPLAREANDRLRALRGNSEELWLADIATLAGDYEAAARYLRRSCESMETRGIRGILSGCAAELGRVLCARGLYDDAEPLAQLGRQLADENDVWAQQRWRQAEALVDAASGKHAEAERLAREAVAIAERTDGLNHQGDALSDLAEVLHAADRTNEAAAALEQAVERYERKKNLAMAARAHERLATLPRQHLPA